MSTDDVIETLKRGFDEANQHKIMRNSRRKDLIHIEPIITTEVWKYFRGEDSSTKSII